MGGTSWDFGSFSIIDAEAMTLKEEIEVAIQMQLDFVTFESNFQMVVPIPTLVETLNLVSLLNRLRIYYNVFSTFR